jgi:hypothetical protein
MARRVPETTTVAKISIGTMYRVTLRPSPWSSTVVFGPSPLADRDFQTHPSRPRAHSSFGAQPNARPKPNAPPWPA